MNTRRGKRNGTKRKMEEDTATETDNAPPRLAEVVTINKNSIWHPVVSMREGVPMHVLCAVSHVVGTVGSLLKGLLCCSINSIIVCRGTGDSNDCCYSQGDAEAAASLKGRDSKKRKVSSVKDACETEPQEAAGSQQKEADTCVEAAVDGDTG